MAFSLVKDLFKWIEGLLRSVMVLVCSEREIMSDIGDLKKVLNTLSNFEPKVLLCSFMKSEFQSDQRLVKMNCGPM